MSQRTLMQRLPFILLIVATLIVVLYVLRMMPNGAGVDINSVNYISAMRSFLAGNDFQQWGGTPLTHWAPLLSIFMAPIGWATTVLNLDFMKAMALANALVFGAMFFFAGIYFLRYLHNKPLALVAAVALLNFPVLHVLVYIISEPLFNLLVLLFTIALTRLLETGKPRWMIAMVIVSVLASLQRYVGIFLVPTGALAILLLLRQYPLRRRFRDAVAYGVFASLGTIGLMIHNYFALGAVSADFGPPQRLLVDDLKTGAHTIVGWFTTQKFDHIPVSVQASAWIALASILIIGAVLFLLRRYWHTRAAALGASVVVLVGYCASLGLLSLRYDFDPPGERFLSPIYVYVIFIVAFFFNSIWLWLAARTRQAALAVAQAVFLCASVVWLINYPLYQAVNELYSVLSVSCCMEPEWFSSPVNEWLRSHPLSGTVFSNTPLPLYYSNTQAIMAPTTLDGWNNPALASKHIYLVWMNYDHYNASTYTLQELSSTVNLKPVAEFSDGGIYSFGA